MASKRVLKKIQIKPSVRIPSTYIINHHLNEENNMEHNKRMNSMISQSNKRIHNVIDTRTQHTLSQLNHCQNIKSVMKIIHETNDKHISIYAKSLKICHKLSSGRHNDHTYVKHIFSLIESEQITFDNYFFCILFDVLSKTKLDSNDLVFYFQKMYAMRDQLKIDTIALSTLFKCCRKCNDIKLAEKIMHLLKDIQLDMYGLNELIVLYGNNKQIKQSVVYFAKLCALDPKPNIIAYGSMLNAFAEIGDVHNIKALIDKMKQDKYLKKQLKKSGAVYTALMKGYLNCTPSKPKKCISVFDLMANRTDCSVLDVHINLKATAYNKLIMDGVDVHKYLDKLLNELPNERQKFVSSVSKYSQQLASQQLKGCCLVYGDDMDSIVQIFEERLREHIGCWKRIVDESSKLERFVLDFYRFSEIITRFMIKYLFEHQREQILNALDENGMLCVICDDDALTNQFDESTALREVIREELLALNEVVDVKVDSYDANMLLVEINASILTGLTQ